MLTPTFLRRRIRRGFQRERLPGTARGFSSNTLHAFAHHPSRLHRRSHDAALPVTRPGLEPDTLTSAPREVDRAVLPLLVMGGRESLEKTFSGAVLFFPSEEACWRLLLHSSSQSDSSQTHIDGYSRGNARRSGYIYAQEETRTRTPACLQLKKFTHHHCLQTVYMHSCGHKLL